MTRSSSILLSVALVLGCGMPLFHAPPRPVPHSSMPAPPTKAEEIQSVAMHLTGCLGRCPSYTYAFVRGRPAFREGYFAVPFAPRAAGALPDTAFDLLAQRLLLSGFFQMDSLVGTG